MLDSSNLQLSSIVMHLITTPIRVLVLLATFAICASQATVTSAQVQTQRTANRVVLPQTGNSTSGLQVTMEAQWIQTGGYFPIKITVQSTTGPVTADRVLLIELVPRYGGNASKVSQVVEIPEGSTSAEVMVLTPQSDMSFFYTVDVWEDGEKIKDLSSNSGFLLNRSQMSGQQGMSILLVGSEQGLMAVQSNLQMSLSGSNSLHFDQMVAGELPTRWIDYSGLDVVCMSIAELQSFAAMNPAAWLAVKDWTVSGGNLWIFDVGPNWERLPEAERLLSFAEKDSGTALPTDRGWTSGDLSSYVQWSNDLGQTRSSSAGQGIATVIRPSITPPGNSKPPEFLHQQLGQGMVLALPGTGPNNNTMGQWSYILNQLGAERMNWSQRHGLVLNEYNPDFWNLMIPGIGLPPVTGFQVLITLFVLVIGPLNFYLLRRWNQLKLLLVTVPVAAALVTILLLGYSLVADGLGVRARVRSLTKIDQTTGDTVTWSRQSYYAGIAPSQPLLFPEDTVVYPIESETNRRRLRNRRGRNWHWDSNGQHLAGWLPTRTPSQLLAISSRTTNRRIEVSTKAEPPTVTNHLGTAIQHLVLVDGAGNYYQATAIGDGDSKELQASNAADATKSLRVAFNENSTEYLPGIGRTGPAIMSGWYPSSARATQSTSLLELGLDTAGLVGQREYVAIVRKSPEVTLGLDSIEEESSFHVIMGDW